MQWDDMTEIGWKSGTLSVSGHDPVSHGEHRPSSQ